jgi:hypothetical protein
MRRVFILLPVVLFSSFFPLSKAGAQAIFLCCECTATAAAGVLFSCPQGDGDALAANGLTVSVRVVDLGSPIPNIPEYDIWLTGCNDALAMCGGSGAIMASAPTNQNGETTITARFAVGGCDNDGVRAVVQGIVIGVSPCPQPCIPIKIRSPDINANFVINLVDFAIFGGSYTSPPNPYNECIDFAPPFGTVNLPDFARYGTHSNHSC